MLRATVSAKLNESSTQPCAGYARAVIPPLEAIVGVSAPVANQQPEEGASCPECGAPPIAGMSCWDQLGAVTAWEWQDPQLQALHFLTVASYNLQHPAQFTDEALAGLRALYKDYLDHSLSATTLRRRAAHAAWGSQRILREQEERLPVLRRWEMTIADVYCQGRAEGAAERVRKWAAVIRREL